MSGLFGLVICRCPSFFSVRKLLWLEWGESKSRISVTGFYRPGLMLFTLLCLLNGYGPAKAILSHRAVGGETPKPPGFGHILTIDSSDSIRRLHQKSLPARFSDPSIPLIVRQMQEAMISERGDGISAVQIGFPVQIILLKRQSGDRRTEVLLNPAVVRVSRSKQGSWERCLSIPWGYRYVMRPVATSVRYQTIEGQVRGETFKYGESAILQQEIEHLEGHLLSDGYSLRDFFPPSEIANASSKAK